MATKESEKEKGKRKEGDNIMEFKEEIISLSLTFCDFYSKQVYSLFLFFSFSFSREAPIFFPFSFILFQSPPPVCVCVGDSPYWILRFASLFLPHFVFYTLPYSRRSWPHIPSRFFLSSFFFFFSHFYLRISSDSFSFSFLVSL